MQARTIYSGLLSDYFEIAAFKILSKVDTIEGSNQHEFNGVGEIKNIFGDCGAEKKEIIATFIYLNEDESKNSITDSFLTWYDARAKSAERTGRKECRLYYQTNDVTSQMKMGDFLAITKKDDVYYVIVAQKDTTSARQLLWLFGIEQVSNDKGFQITKIENNKDHHINLASRFILEVLGIQVKETDENYIDLLNKRFDNRMPDTAEFALLTQEILTNDINSIDDPDDALVKLFSKEEILYKTLENQRIVKKLQSWKKPSEIIDVEGFINFSLSIQNARKSRAGRALENHLSFVFKKNGIKFERNKITENKNKPDFIFPSIKDYHDTNISESLVTMLASKSTCKDRWRQVLSEAEKIQHKHLFTLEPSISENQTNEMKAKNLILVLPTEIKTTYTTNQQKDILTLKDFIYLIKTKEIKYSGIQGE